MTDKELNLKVEVLLQEMTLEEKAQLCFGDNSRNTNAIPRLGIPALTILDSPNGLRWNFSSTCNQPTATALPCCIANAASFNPETGRKTGAVYGLDARSVGCHAVFGPGMNLMRSPLCGRNFEYLGEDPWLTGKIAAGVIQGCQQLGVAACPKHFAFNNQEVCRTIVSVHLTEQTARELYLKSFEIAVKEAHPWMIMSSYNRIDGQYAGECGWLQDLIAKREWGFDGVMLSDWGGGHDTVGCAVGGLDLAMPGGAEPYRVHLLRAVKTGAVPESAVDEHARRVLRLILRVTQDLPKVQCELGGEKQQQLAQEIALDSITLLKNQNSILPLLPGKIRRLAVVGPNADLHQHRGVLALRGSSGAQFTEREVTPLDGLRSICQKNNIRLDYYSVGKFSFDRGILPDCIASDGVSCRCYRSAKEMQEDAAPMLDRKLDGIHWPWITTQTKAEPGIPEKCFTLDDGFTAHITCAIRPPKGQTHGKLLISAWLARLKVKVDGKAYSDSASQAIVFSEIKFDKETSKELDITLEAQCGVLSGLEFHWVGDESGEISRMLQELPQADAVVFAGGSHHIHDREAIGIDDAAGADLPDLELPENQNDLLKKILSVNPRVIAVLFQGTPLNIEPWIEQIPALMSVWYPGEGGGTAIAKLLFGEAEPAGRLPFTWGKKLTDYAPHALNAYPCDDRKAKIPREEYKENLLIGYRWFEHEKIMPRYPFGFGLSYTDFKRELVSVNVENADAEMPEVDVTVRVANTGTRAGFEVVQLYLGRQGQEPERPLRELRGFQKLFLQPGESKEYTFRLGRAELVHWFPLKKRWKVMPGIYSVSIGANAGKPDAEAKFEIKKQALPKWMSSNIQKQMGV